MKSRGVFNDERVRALSIDPNAYVRKEPEKKDNPHIQDISKVVFPEPYENAHSYYNRSEFNPPPPPPAPPISHNHQPSAPMFDIKSLLPLLTQGGGMMDMLKPIISMLSGGKGGENSGLGDVSKIFELFKPKTNSKKVENEVEEISKFDDMNIIIE